MSAVHFTVGSAEDEKKHEQNVSLRAEGGRIVQPRHRAVRLVMTS